MRDFTWKNNLIPSYEDLSFLYNLCKQGSVTSTINYIASNFNSIQDINQRKIKVYDWIQALKWMLHRVESYDLVDFHNSFCKRVFKDGLYNFDFFILYNVLELLENLKNYHCLQKAIEEDVITYTIPEISDEDYKSIFREDILKTNTDDFASHGIAEQRYILEIYEQFCIKREYWMSREEEDVADEMTLDEMANNSIAEQYKTKENIELITRVCQNLMRIRAIDNTDSFSDSEIAHLIDQSIRIDENLNLVAYFLQYIIISFGASITTQKPLDIMKVSGKQSDILQRLLCAITTQEWKRAEGKGLLYYKTVNNMFKIDIDNVKESKRKILAHLAKVRIMLDNGGFDDAVELLDKDVKTINGE